MSEPYADDSDAAAKQRQRIEKVPGRRRARLTPAPGTDPSPEVAPKTDEPARPAGRGPNDEQLLRDIPPHY
ncbi:hypothetical protein [Microbacterium abyssi]|uniref:hypothetical protein n=1 Tax=Microbacterium abyssi TaxID=2782166 RepID=UPI001887499E|nr:hypothetical protein [Microbacterium sp. A18JL241]